MRELTINAVSAYPSLQKGTYLSSSWLLSQCSASTWSCHACCSPQPFLLPAWRACRAFLFSSHPQLVSTSVWGIAMSHATICWYQGSPTLQHGLFQMVFSLQANSLGTVHASYLFICWERVSLDSSGRVQTFFAEQASLKLPFSSLASRMLSFQACATWPGFCSIYLPSILELFRISASGIAILKVNPDFLERSEAQSSTKTT